MSTDNSGPAYPLHPDLWSDDFHPGGLSQHELACIELRVPKTGDDDLDDLIEEANRRDFAMAAMQGLCANPEHAGTPGNELCKYSVNLADALLAELAK